MKLIPVFIQKISAFPFPIITPIKSVLFLVLFTTPQAPLQTRQTFHLQQTAREPSSNSASSPNHLNTPKSSQNVPRRTRLRHLNSHTWLVLRPNPRLRPNPSNGPNSRPQTRHPRRRQGRRHLLTTSQRNRPPHRRTRSGEPARRRHPRTRETSPRSRRTRHTSKNHL